MNEPKRKGISGGYSSSHKSLDDSKRWKRSTVLDSNGNINDENHDENEDILRNEEKSSSSTEITPLINPLILPNKNEKNNQNNNEILLLSSSLQLKGTAQPRIALYKEDPSVLNASESQTTEIIFENISSCNFHTLFEISLHENDDNYSKDLFFCVFSGVFEEDQNQSHEDDEIKNLIINHDDKDGQTNINDDLINEIDPETKETCIGFASISCDDIVKNFDNHSSIKLNLIGSDGLSNGFIELHGEKKIEISKEKQENMFIKNYCFHSDHGDQIYVQDEMGESPLAFSIATQLLSIAFKKKTIEFAQFQKSFEDSKNVILLDKRFVVFLLYYLSIIL